jgi:hypothetical protein
MAKSKPKPTKPAKSPAPTGAAKAPKPNPKLYIVFGADEYARPRAARFSGPDPDLLARAVAALHLRVIEATDPDLEEIAKSLPAGRLHGTSLGVVPFVKGDLYMELILATTGDQQPAPDAATIPETGPQTWDDVAPGDLVVAKESLECGWWEAIVVERNGDLATVHYRDYPHYHTMVRHRSAIALIALPAPKPAT